MGLLGIVLSLGLLMYLAYRGINVLILAPLLALLAVLLSGDLPILATYTQVFMRSLGGYVIIYFPLFLLGAIFGKVMADSGAARTIAEKIVASVGAHRAILAVVLACGVLTYGGVSLFVVAFAIYPIANALFRRADVPKRLLPAAIALGSFTFTMTAFPGTPAIQNAIPMPFFGTNVFAAPILGTIAGVIMLVGGVLWLNRRSAAAHARSEGYGDHPRTAADSSLPEDMDLPGFGIAILPVVSVIVLNAVFTYIVIPRMDASYLAQPEYGATTLQSVAGIWAIIVALVLSIVLAIALNWHRFTNLTDSVNSGTMGSLLPIFNTASEVGYGAVIASLPAFAIIRDAVLGLFPTNPVASLAVAVNVLAGITGSASGGMSIALQALGEQFAAMAREQGISMELMHRVTALASGGFDALPHNGAVITLLAITGLTHKKSYGDIFVVSVAIPVFATIVVILLGAMG
ncbi:MULTISPECIES: GntP family permease [unclassified Paracoccus (in: a-proteobacteria)]|uniref:GntP family permease n=1 Tax=unclassified Paracoccus (in: a-proteobacteria) TaxID=2688777 RepID=UPI0016013CD8|nr:MULTISPECIES: GntP family permease [unclassified Paracoccus (in: a-proteobacteria)]MBB1492336.1 GntP family permease [Paracoccus sp. MC1854]MBB1498415.1 GntP family permease [Paracoccus sp. MC1862]QQO46668.1 GntP family permease [Paracoccus sp. MC1862]